MSPPHLLAVMRDHVVQLVHFVLGDIAASPAPFELGYGGSSGLARYHNRCQWCKWQARLLSKAIVANRRSFLMQARSKRTRNESENSKEADQRRPETAKE